MGKTYDFSGWATKANVRCTDGRVIRHDAFKDCDGKTVPLVWSHQHHNPENVMGHALLKNTGDGVYAYGTFNDTKYGLLGKSLVSHGDITSLSILANDLVQKGTDVVHGIIREVSLVLAGANPEAFIDEVMAHGDNSNEPSSAVMYFGEPLSMEADSPEDTIEHADEIESETNSENGSSETEEGSDAETIGDIFETFTEKQKAVAYSMVGEALNKFREVNGNTVEHSAITNNTEGGNDNMKKNLFENDSQQKDGVLSHDAVMTIIGDAKRYGSMKESFLAHAADYGVENLEYLFPDDRKLTNTPTFIKRDTSWVSEFMGAIRHTPFSRIKSIFADITADDARAKGYLKGNMKKEEFFSLIKRSTSPTTVYKKQKMDRDDVIDITDFDVIAWLKSEMRLMLDEELARAGLVGDGRLASSDDKINEQNIRPIWTDDDLFTIKAPFTVSGSATDDDKARAFIRTCIKSRKDYKGSGSPILYTTEDVLTNCLLLTDANGRDLYESVDKLATKLRVRKIVTVPVMEGLSRTVASDKYELFGIIVNPTDYTIGADKGGAINMFDDFDIDYNQQKYLIETRCSGALTLPYSAIAVELKTTVGG